MSDKSNFRKFQGHFKSGGLLYAFWRGLKYLHYLLKARLDRARISVPAEEQFVAKNKIKLSFHQNGVKIFWDGRELTPGVGLNVGINTLGLWTDSAKAAWQIIRKTEDSLKLKVTFRELPLYQIWSLKIENGSRISWRIDLSTQEWLHIDEFRIVCLINPYYKSWLSDFQQVNFVRADSLWRDLFFSSEKVSWAGARFSTADANLPSFLLEADDKKFLSVVQSPPEDFHARIIGLRYISESDKRCYHAGEHPFFSGEINFYQNEDTLDAKLEAQRRIFLHETINEKTGDNPWKRKELKVILANLPWRKNGQCGVRAGSRWPHIKDRSEGNYLPFPFFLAHAASLLEKKGIQAKIIDALAEESEEDDFIARILSLGFDYLVAETSIPSFYHDLELLKRISRSGISIILCGPNSEIYNPEFLENHSFVDYVLFGEYEFSLLELVEAIKGNRDLSGVAGLIFRDQQGRVVKNKRREPFDINLLPWPHRETLPMLKYWDLPGNIPLPSAQMLASRGCPFGCNFCLWPQVMYAGNHYRVRDVVDVVDEMEFLVRKKGFNSVYFDDDTFNVGKERMLEFCRQIKERGLEKTPWAIMARADLMDKEILSEMKSSGLWAVKYGVESKTKCLLDKSCKGMNLDKALSMINLTKQMGIKTHLTFCFGFDGETSDTVRRTIDCALELDPDSVQFSILTPFPGTKIFEQLEKEGRILTNDWSKYDGHYNCVFKPDTLSPGEVLNAKRRAYCIWADSKRRKRGLLGDLKLARYYFNQFGPKYLVCKIYDYLLFIWVKRKRYISEGV